MYACDNTLIPELDNTRPDNLIKISLIKSVYVTEKSEVSISIALNPTNTMDIHALAITHHHDDHHHDTIPMATSNNSLLINATARAHTHAYHNLHSHPLADEEILEICILVVIAIAALFGNALIIMAFVTGQRRIRSFTNYLVVSMRQ